MKTLKEALSNFEKNNLIDALQTALDIVDAHSNDLESGEADMLLRRLNDFNSTTGRDKLMLKTYLESIGIYNTKSIFDEIEEVGSYREALELAYIDNLPLKEFISYLQKGYNITEIVLNKLSKDGDFDSKDLSRISDFIGNLMSIKEQRSKMTGPGELLLKLILSDVKDSDKSTCDIYCNSGSLEVKSLVVSSANIFGKGKLYNISKKNLDYNDIKMLDELTSDIKYFRNEILDIKRDELNAAIASSNGKLENIKSQTIIDHIKVLYLKFKDYHNEHLKRTPDYIGELIIYGDQLNGFILSTKDISGNFNINSPENMLRFLYIMSNEGLKVIKTNDEFEFGKYKK